MSFKADSRFTNYVTLIQTSNMCDTPDIVKISKLRLDCRVGAV
jgi:hypothetical protein